jgi:hypothetical protein
MDFVPLLLLTALVKKAVDFVKYATSGDINAVVTQIVAWAMGIGMAFLAANSDWADSVLVNGQPLSTLNGWSLALVGVNIASLAGFGWDTVKALDNKNSAVVPDLLAHPSAATRAAHQPVVD